MYAPTNTKIHFLQIDREIDVLTLYYLHVYVPSSSQ